MITKRVIEIATMPLSATMKNNREETSLKQNYLLISGHDN